MRLRWIAPLCALGSFACSDSDRSAESASNAGAAAGNASPSADTTETLPLTGAAKAADDGATLVPAAPGSGSREPAPSDTEAEGMVMPFAIFMDPTTGFATDEVRDADREIVHFEPGIGAMVSRESGDSVSGWSVNGIELRWSRSGVPFRVRFGTEQGERRAYFTEAGPGTICNLSLTGPDVLFISGTSETPPNP
jgi:hypothetical protein